MAQVKAEKTETKKEPKDKAAAFRKLAEKRISKLLKTVGHIGNLANRSSYEYTEQQIKKMFSAIRSEIDAAEARFAGGKSSSRQFRF